MLVRFPAFVALLVMVGVVAGCGGGGSSSGGSTGGETPGGELTKAEFIERADAVCTTYNEEALPIEEKLLQIEQSGQAETPRSEAKLDELRKEATGDAESELSRIQALEPPKGDAATIEAMLGQAEESEAIGLEAVEAFEAGDTQKFKKLAPKVEAVNKKARSAAEAYGLKVCGQKPEIQRIS